MDKTLVLNKMVQFMNKLKHQNIYRERAFKVELMQGIVKDIFELYHCWMPGDRNNGWIFPAMCLAIKKHQFDAFKKGR